ITYRENRRLLYHVMTQAGFTNYIEEWWHFDYGNQNWATVSKRDFAVYGATKPAFPWI
ncbi:D-alanyl-D-alanine dipeptidase, partial [Lactobacillaceae bacterium KNUT 0156]|nr:D-alanyl-D-alanine dipeptidase [Weissella cibaria]